MGPLGIDHMLPHYVKIHPTYEKSTGVCMLHFNKNFNMCLKSRCRRCPHVRGA